MADYIVELRGAKPQNGHSGEDPITAKIGVDAVDWFDAREKAARRYSVGVFDPAMLAYVREPDHVLEEPPPPSKPAKKIAARKR